MLLQDTLTEVEHGLWRQDVALYEEWLLPDVVLIFAEGGRLDREQAIEWALEEQKMGRHWVDVRLSDVMMTHPNDDAALLCYSATARWNDETHPVQTLCSSLYVRRSRGWRMAFHQQTSA